MDSSLIVVVLIGGLIQAGLIGRGCLSESFRRYPFFFSYVACSLTGALFLIGILVTVPSLYGRFYWPMEFVTLSAGCGIVFELFRHVLAPYRGACRFAKTLCIVTFGVIFAVVLVGPYLGFAQHVTGSEIGLERDVRAAQIFFFVAILSVIGLYRIPLGRNMSGLLYGYGVYLATNLINLSLRSYLGLRFNVIWNALQPGLFDLSLAIWLVAFWSYRPNPLPAATIHLEEDYDALVTRTSLALKSIRQQAVRAIRQ